MPTPHRILRDRSNLLRRQRRISRLLATLLAPFCGWSLAQVAPPPTVLNLSATALPQGGQVRLGSATLSGSGSQLLIQQSTNKLGIDWQRFDIGRDATVEFRQPGRDAVALNRVVGHDPSAIFGQLLANGQVFLTNPNGVLFAPGSRVDVGGLIASTLDLSQEDFAAGHLRFEGGGGSVVQRGRIEAERYVALFGGQVSQGGEIVAPDGSVVLASGRAATVALDDSGLLTATVEGGAPGRIDQSGLIDVDGGRVQMSARSAAGQAPSLVNTEGLVRASAIERRGGEIVIEGDAVRTRGTLAADGVEGGRIRVRGDMQAGRIDIGGTLSARGRDAGGHIETSAAQVAIDPGVAVDTRAVQGRTGEWLIDPTDFVVGAGSGALTASGIGASTLQSALGTSNVTLQTAADGTQAGDIRVEAPVSWSADTTLTLSAIHDVAINADLTATGNAAGLTISAGSGQYTLGDGVAVTLSGSSPSLSINGRAYVVINSLAALQAINTDATSLGRNYALGTDLDASATAGWNDGAGFLPIGNSSYYQSAFRGYFDGLGHRLSGLWINRPTAQYTGLFGYSEGADLRNLTLDGGRVVGGQFVGALVGYMYGGTGSTIRIENVHSSVDVVSAPPGNSYSTVYIGGLAGLGYLTGGISRSSSSGEVFSDSYDANQGGLVGYAYRVGSIVDSAATGRVTHQSSGFDSNYGELGGLVGWSQDTSLLRVSASGDVTGGSHTGGLVGQMYGQTQTDNDGNTVFLHSVREATASGDVTTGINGSYAGGLVGYISRIALSDASASGHVQGRGSYMGGLVGYLSNGEIVDSVASGRVDATGSYAGGLVGSGSTVTISGGRASGDVVTTGSYAGGLMGYASSNIDIADSEASGDVTGSSTVGGLLGSLYVDSGNGRTLRRSRASGDVRSGNIGGGLIGSFEGYNSGTDEFVAIDASHASGSVRARTIAGGLIGQMSGGGIVIQDSSASGAVTATGLDGESNTVYLGGLIGTLYDYGAYYVQRGSELRRVFATGTVGVDDTVAARRHSAYGGGLIGYLYDYGGNPQGLSILDSHADGAVALRGSGGTAYGGGLIGYAYGANVQRAYASGAITATGYTASELGGLIGNYAGTGTPVADSYWNADTTGLNVSAGGGTALSDAQMRQAASFAGWDLSGNPGEATVWRIYEGLSQPLLRGQLTPFTLTLADAEKAYDGGSSLAGTGLGSPGLLNPELVLVGGLSPDAGSTAISPALIYSRPGGYDLTVSGSGTLTITARSITLDGLVAGKVYDGTTTAAFIAGAQPSGLVAGEDLTFDLGSASAVFADKNAGTGKAVTVTGHAVGDGVKGKAANYTIVGTASADISPKVIDAGGFSATDRVYDGTTAVAVSYTGSAPSGIVAGDVVSVSGTGATGTLADKHAGTDRPVTVSGISLTGADAGNYLLAGIDALTVTISPRPVAVTGLTAASRQYNGSTSVSVSGSSGALGALVDGDIVGYSNRNLTGTMADKNVGTGKTVTVGGLTLVGPDAADYTPTAADLTVDITPRNVTGYLSTLNGGGGGNYGWKLYDGSADASTVAAVYGSGLIGSDGVTISSTDISFASKNVAYSGANVVNQTITGSGFALSGAEAYNYTLTNTSDTVSGRIVPRNLTVTGVSAIDRVYDGTVNVVVNIDGAAVDSGQLVAGDDVSVTVPGGGAVTGTVANKNVGTNKAVTVPGLALAGADALNYTLTGSNGVTVDITRKDLTVSYVGQSKVYNGNAHANAVASSTDVVAGDDVRFYTNLYNNGYCNAGYYYCSIQFTGDGAKNVGTDKPIAILEEYLYGSDAGNYRIVNAGSGTAVGSITPRPITPSVTGVDKVYDGTVTASVTLNGTASGVVSGDAVTVGTSNALFTGTGAKNVGTGKPVEVSSITLAGADAPNYTLTVDTASTTASITPKPVNVTGISAVNRIYDGTLTVAVTADAPAVAGLIAGDDVGAVLPVGGISSGTMDDRHAGTGKPFSVAGVTLAGTDAGNYTLAGSGGTVDIAPKPITASFTGVNKVYDGNTTATVVGASGGLVDGVGDVVGFTQSAVFSAATGGRNAGVGKTVEVSNIVLTGAQAGNYTLTSTTGSTTADITPKSIGVTYTGLDRVYNGTADTSAGVIGSASGLVAGDSVGLNQTARFAPDGSVGSGKTINVTDISLAGVNAGNYTLTTTTATTSANILPRALGVAGISAIDRVYDGTTTVQVAVDGAAVDLTGVVAGDSVTVSLPPEGLTTGEMADRHVGVGKGVSISGLLLAGSGSSNYVLSGADALTVTITPKAVTATFTGTDKIYDGSPYTNVSGTSDGFVAGDTVAITADGTFTGSGAKNVGVDKALAVSSGRLTGADRLNYSLSNPTGETTASITPRTLTAVYTGGERIYDGTVLAPVSGVLSNRVSNDVLTLTQAAEFTGPGAKDVGNGKPIAITDIAIGGADAGNYVLSGTTASATGRITPRPVVIEGLSGITATNRVYDGTTAVAVDVPAGLSGTPRAGDILAGETVAVDLPPSGAATGQMADKHVGTDKPVLVDGLGLSGTDAGNYMIAAASGVTVDISPLTISATYSGVNRVYDGTTVAGVAVALPGRLAGDALTGSATGLFTDGKNVGSAKPIAVTGGVLAGADAGNYLLANATGGTSADVTPKAVTASYAGGTRVYDGTTTAPVTGSLGGLVGGDTVTLSQSAVFAGGKNVGSAKLINVSGIAIAGTDAGNYALTSSTATTTGSITPRPVVVEGLTVSAEGREYDGTTQVTVQVTASAGAGPRPGDLIAGDTVTLLVPAAGATTGQMADKHAGTGKAIVVDGLGLTGADAGNYSIVGTSGLTVDIAPRTLTATWTGVDKVYDGTNAASATGTGDRVVAGDVLTLLGSGTFDAGRNAGTGLAITIASAVLGGADAANYQLNNPTGSTSAAITPKTLSVTYAGGTKVYDGTTTAPVEGTLGGLIDGDAVGLTQTAEFTGAGAKNVGSAKPVTVSGITLTGTDAANYRSNIAATTTTAGITPRPVVIEGLNASATSREYDGTTAVSVDLVAASGVAPRAGDLIAGDDVTVSVPGTGGTFGTMADKHVGTGKAVVIDGLGLTGADAANYRIEGVQGVTVDITPRTLTAAWLGNDKVYDGSDAGTATGSGDRVVAGDVLSIVGQGVFTAGRNAGTALALDIRSATMEGADAGNYTLLNPTASVSATIRPRTVTAVYSGIDKVYDATSVASVSGTVDDAVSGDVLSLSQTAFFTGGKNVGTGKAVQVTGIVLEGTDAGNYVLAATEAGTTASITPKAVSVSGLTGLTAQDREYDGTRTVALSGSLAGSAGLEGVFGGDVVTLVQGGGAPTQGTMADKHVGSAKGVVIEGLALSGADAVNYVLADTLGLTVNITPRTITASGLQPVERMYDGSTVIALNTAAAALSGALSGDDLTLRVDGATASVADRHAGVAKPVLLDGVALDGADAGNYRLASAEDLRVTITPRPLSLAVLDLSKTYGDALLPTGTGFTAQGLVDGEVVDRLALASDGLPATAAVGSYALYATGAEGSGGFDVANYLISYQAAALLVNPRPLTLTALLQSKRYGEVLGFTGTEFGASPGGLANGDTIGSVLLDSSGSVGTAAAGEYGISISGAGGGSFNAANYAISYQPGVLRVDPRPLTVATQSVVRYADEPNPASFGFATSPGSLVNGDRVASVTQLVPPGSDGAPGGSVFELLPSDATFGPGSAANYQISYRSGLLIVLPKPPRIDDPDGGTTGVSGDPQFAIVLDPEDLARAEAALRRQSSVADGGPGPSQPGGGAAGEGSAETDAQAAAVIAALLRGETQQVSLPVLLRLPLISMDPNLRRLILGAVTTP